MKQMFPAQFGQIVSGMTGRVPFGIPTRRLSDRFRQLRQREPIRLGGQANHGIHHGPIAGFIRINARQSPNATRCSAPDSDASLWKESANIPDHVP